jgi:hypothetical protein
LRGLSNRTAAFRNLRPSSSRAWEVTFDAVVALILVWNLKAGSLKGFDGSTLPDDTDTWPPLSLEPNLLGTLLLLGFFTSTTKGLPGA